ncbi:hypothetical protein LTX12_000932 [Clostridium perfringens]|uniref:hypothetical protein n=1 Tax=Clostridium perfringens TaxID=1502 RepID=UPI001D71B13D|nr:hypothetical protein [Clostridium perfringens]
MIFDGNIKKNNLDKLDIKELYYIFNFIEIYIRNEVVERFKSLGSVQEIKIEKSIFDEYDKEEGYEEEREITIYENLLDTLYSIFRFARKQCNMSLKECLDISIVDLLDYINSEFEYLEENKDKDYTDV